MKIIMGGNGSRREIRINLEDEQGNYIVLLGTEANDYRPFYATQLDEGEDERLRKWLHDIHLSRQLSKDIE